jgi:hypothetical protein
VAGCRVRRLCVPRPRGRTVVVMVGTCPIRGLHHHLPQGPTRGPEELVARIRGQSPAVLTLVQNPADGRILPLLSGIRGIGRGRPNRRSRLGTCMLGLRDRMARLLMGMVSDHTNHRYGAQRQGKLPIISFVIFF